MEIKGLEEDILAISQKLYSGEHWLGYTRRGRRGQI